MASSSPPVPPPESVAALMPVLLEGLGGGFALHDAELRRSFAVGPMDGLLGLPPEMAAVGTPLADQLAALQDARRLGPAEAAGILAAFSGPGRQGFAWRRPDGGRLELTVLDAPCGGRVALCREAAEDRAAPPLRRADDIAILMDAGGNLLEMSGRTREVLGLSPGPGCVAGGWDVLRHLAARGDFGPGTDPEDFARQGREDLLQSGRLTLPGRLPGGAWVEYEFRVLEDGHLLAHVRDVSALKATKLALRQREAELEAERVLLREVIDSSDALIALFDAGGTVLLANDRHKELLGLPPELFEPGGSFLGAMEWLGQHGFYGGAGEMGAEIHGRLTRIHAGEITRFSRQMQDGRWLEFTYRVISGGRMIGQARDITPLKQREAELEAERALLREVLDSTDALVTLFDAEAKVLLANARHRELLGVPQELYAPGQDLDAGLRWMARRGDFGPVGDEDVLVRAQRELIFRCVEAGGTKHCARRMPDGRWVEFTYTMLSGRRLISQARDVTPLKSSEQAALAAQAEAEAARDAAEAAAQAKSAFLAAMSHEIRTPMNGVLGMLELLERSELGPDQARSVVVMRDSAQSLLRIIDDVLDFSKIEAGRMEVEALPFSLRSLIEGTVETLMPQARQRGLTLFADPADPGPDWLEGDPTRVRQILFNLIGNALKFTERGFVRLAAQTRLEEGGASVRLIVEDSGVGMDEETLARLFRPFTQADSSTTRRFGGTGLGLSIVRRLTELMDGEVRAESTPGRGSRFLVTLRLRVAEAPAAAAREATGPAPVVPGGGPLGRVLVVDDHPVNREVITRQLELLGLPAATADDGAQGLEHWRWHRPPVVLLDIHMPRMDGFEMARAIRQEEQARGLSRTTLIAVTANALKGEAERCYAAGMDAFVTKPVTLDGLSRALGRFMPELVREGAPAGGALFDPDALRGLFGQDRERLLGILESFAEQAAHDIGRLKEAEGGRLAEAAHRLKGSARMVGARLLAEAAQAIEEAARSSDVLGVEASRGQLDKLLVDTLAVARPALGGAPPPSV